MIITLKINETSIYANSLFGLNFILDFRHKCFQVITTYTLLFALDSIKRKVQDIVNRTRGEETATGGSWQVNISVEVGDQERLAVVARSRGLGVDEVTATKARRLGGSVVARCSEKEGDGTTGRSLDLGLLKRYRKRRLARAEMSC